VNVGEIDVKRNVTD